MSLQGLPKGSRQEAQWNKTRHPLCEREQCWYQACSLMLGLNTPADVPSDLLGMQAGARHCWGSVTLHQELDTHLSPENTSTVTSGRTGPGSPETSLPGAGGGGDVETETRARAARYRVLWAGGSGEPSRCVGQAGGWLQDSGRAPARLRELAPGSFLA